MHQLKVLPVSLLLLTVHQPATASQYRPDARARMEAACKAMNTSDYITALKHLDAAVALAPRSSDAYLRRAIVLTKLGQRARAGQDLYESQKTIDGRSPALGAKCRLDASASEALRRLRDDQERAKRAKSEGIVLFLDGDADAAVRKLDESIRHDPGDVEAYQSRAVAREKAGDVAGALEDYKEVFALAARRPEFKTGVLENVSRLHERRGELVMAARALTQELVSIPADDPRRRVMSRRLRSLHKKILSRARAEDRIARLGAGAEATFRRLRESGALARKALSSFLGYSLNSFNTRWRTALPAPRDQAPSQIKTPPSPRMKHREDVKLKTKPRPTMPPRMGRSPEEYAWALSELRRLGQNVVEDVVRASASLEIIYDRLQFWDDIFALEVRYIEVLGENNELLGVVLPDGQELSIKEKDVQSYLKAVGQGGNLVAGLGLWTQMRSHASLAADQFGRNLALYDLVLSQLADQRCHEPASRGNAPGCLGKLADEVRLEKPLPMFEFDILLSTIARNASLEYARSRPAMRTRDVAPAMWGKWTGLPLEENVPKVLKDDILLKQMARLWHLAQDRSPPHDPWIPPRAMWEAISTIYPSTKADGTIFFYPRGSDVLSVPVETKNLIWKAREPWELITSLSAQNDEKLLPLSPWASDELAEFLCVTAGLTLRRAAELASADGAAWISARHLRAAALIWDEKFDPAPTKEPPSQFREIPPERSSLALPTTPEAPLEFLAAPAWAPGGLAVLDYDQDRLPDIFLCDHSQVRLYHNLDSFHFKEVAASVGLSGVSCDYGASSADYNNDGWPDLLTLHDAKEANHLFRNDHGAFIDATVSMKLSTAPAETVSAVWMDFDRDGRLDLYLVENEPYDEDSMGEGGEIMNSRPNRLYRNLGNRFKETAGPAGVADRGRGLAAASFDYDDDGWPDLDVVNDFGRNHLYRNQGDGTFRNVSRRAGVDSFGSGMGISVADFDHDGRRDIFLTYIGAHRPWARGLFLDAYGGPRISSEKTNKHGKYLESNRLYRNRGDGTFEDSTAERIENVPTGWGWNGFFLDADNSGWQDIYQVNGWWPHRFVFSDESNIFWRFDPASGRFLDSSESSGADFGGESRVSAYADLDHDGCLDLIVTGFHQPRLFAGRCSAAHHWVTVKLEGAKSNRDGIGAVVTVRAGNLTQTEEMGYQGGGFMNSLSREIHFGLGPRSKADSLEVRWPSGIRQRLGPLKADHLVVIRETAANDPMTPGTR